MNKSCRQCATKFEVTDSDIKFYEKISPVIEGKKYLVPPPTLCPDCRQQRRLAFRNENTLYKRKCDLCAKETVSTYTENEPFPVYCQTCWWSDKWDPFTYGIEFDFSRPFFPQFHDLLMKVPKAGLLNLSNENSEYTNFVAFSKNTYMSPGSYFLEDSYFSRKSQYCKDCINNNFIDNCEMTSYSINCKSCYNCSNLVNCRNCIDCRYMADSIGCKNCFMCSGLTNKEYHYKNKPVSKEEMAGLIQSSARQNQEKLLQEFHAFSETVPKKYQNQISCTDSTGDYIQNCKNAVECYDCFNVVDSKYLIECVESKDCMDMCMHDKKIELCYENSAGGDGNYSLLFSYCSCDSTSSCYLNSCFYLEDSFGCDSIHSKSKNCILNKKYPAEEYTKLKAKIIEHMMKTAADAGQAGEWGEFFPPELSPYPVNNSAAQKYQPITKEEAQKRGFKWNDAGAIEMKGSTVSLPDDITQVPDSIISEILSCQKCRKNYRIVNQELKLSRKLNVPLSKFCTDCRQENLQELKNPRKLYARACAKCSTPIQTTYSPNRPEKVYCETCYLKELY